MADEAESVRHTALSVKIVAFPPPKHFLTMTDYYTKQAHFCAPTKLMRTGSELSPGRSLQRP